MKKSENNELPINIQLWHLKTKQKWNIGPSTSSKIWTFAVSTVTKSALHIALAEVDWKRKGPEKKGKSKWWFGLKLLSFSWDPSTQMEPRLLHTDEARPTTRAFQI